MVAKNTKSKTQNLKIRTGDTVRVLLGKDRGKTGKIMAVLPQHNKVLVEKINMVHKHIRARRAGEKGQRVLVAAPLEVSNVQLVCPSCKKGTRVGIKRENGERQRVCRKCEGRIN